MTTERRPWLAALLGLLLPGLGHLYAGHVRPAVIWWAINLIQVAILLALLNYAPFGIAALLVVLALSLMLRVGAAFSAARLSGAAPNPYHLEPYNRWYIYLAVCVATGAPATFFMPPPPAAFRIPSASMDPTIRIGDYIYCTTSPTLPPVDGSIVTFLSVDEPGLKVLKRIIGTPGDTIAMVGGQLSRNGRQVPEPYLATQSPRSENPEMRARMLAWQAKYLLQPDSNYAPDLDHWGPLVVPPESLFVMGDNRASSWDSRYWGFVPVDHITGEARVIYFSYDPEAWTPLPALTAIRWSRIGLRFP